jgi:hypothetical protein
MRFLPIKASLEPEKRARGEILGSDIRVAMEGRNIVRWQNSGKPKTETAAGEKQPQIGKGIK